MKRLLPLIGSLFSAVTVLGIPLVPFDVDSQKLLASPTVLVGRIDGVTAGKNDKVIYHGRPVEINVSKASVEIGQFIPSGQDGKRLFIDKVLIPANPDDYIDRQIPEIGKDYVFFLSGVQGRVEYEPFFPAEFGLVIEKMPKNLGDNRQEVLRNISILNIEATNRFVAERWARFLYGIYNPAKDLSFWTNKISDSRTGIKAIALVTLAENAPQTEGLESWVVKFLESEPEGVGIMPQRLCSLLPSLVDGAPSIANIQSWLGSKSKEVKIVALKWIHEKRDPHFVPDVVHLMVESKDRDIQYECIKTLYELKGGELIAYPEFLSQPEQYVQQWRKVGGDAP